MLAKRPNRPRGLALARRSASRKARAGRAAGWSGAGMDTFAERTPDTADEPDELETADAPSVPTTDDDDAPVDNPSGG